MTQTSRHIKTLKKNQNVFCPEIEKKTEGAKGRKEWQDKKKR